MSLKTLREIAAESNSFDAALNAAIAAGEQQKWASGDLIAWLHDCVAHGRYLPPGSPEREALQSLVDYWTSRLMQLEISAPEEIERLADFDSAAGIPLTDECPYPGLEPYSEGLRVSFFGREPLIRECVAHLEDPARQLFLIIGASGSGKSSLALAGVMPELEKRHRDEWWIAPPFTPGSEPLAAMAVSIAQAIGQSERASDIERMLAGNQLTDLAGLCQGKPILLLVDQLEELFTLCRDDGVQKAFGHLLMTLTTPGASWACRILLTLRTDHLARLESNDALQALHVRLIAADNHRYLSPIGFADIQRAIAEPAKRVGLRFVPPELVGRLATQTAGLTSGLPLLQFALRRLWETRPRNADGVPLDLITSDMVDALPDVQKALGTLADELFQQFTPSQQQICERLLQELVILDENFEEPLRRRRNEAELTRVLVDRRLGTKEDVAVVIDQFLTAGLLRRFGNGPARQIEVAHEALLRHWDRINQLVTGQEVKERLHLIKQIGREAAEWASRGRSEGYLNVRGERLARALEYGREDWLVEAESAEYIEACRRRAEVEKEHDAQRQATRKAAERAEVHRRIWKGTVFAVTPLMVALLVMSWSLWRSRDRIRAEQQRALGLGLAGASILAQVEQPSLLEPSVLYAAAAGRLLKEPNPGQMHALQQGLYLLPKQGWPLDHGGMVWRVAFSPDGRFVAAVGEDKTVRVFDVSSKSGRPMKELAQEGNVWAVAFSPDGAHLAVGGDGGVRVLETKDWKEAWPKPFGDAVTSLAFGPDGRALVLGGSYGAATAVAVKGGAQLWRKSYGGTVWSVVFSPDGKVVAVAADDPKGGLIRSSDGVVIREFGRATQAVSFSADGSAVVTAGDTMVRVVRVDGKANGWDELSHDGKVVTVACSRDCRYVVSGSGTNARVFDAMAGRLLSTLAHGGAVNAVALSPDGRWIATASSDGTARVFGALDGRETLRQSSDDQREVAAVAFSPSGRYLTTGSAIFEGANGYEMARVKNAPEVNQMALSADGDYLATISAEYAYDGAGDGHVRVVDLKTGQAFGRPLGIHGAYVAVSNGGRYVAAASAFGVEVLSVASGQRTWNKDFPSAAVKSIDLSPDGRFVLIGEDKTVHMIDTLTGNPTWTMAPLDEPVSVVAFSYDGQSFAVGSRAPKVWVFSVATGMPMASVANGLPHEFVGARCKPPSVPCQVSSLSFSRDGKHLVTGSDDKTARVFDLTNGREERKLPHVGTVVYATFTRENPRYLATASNDLIGRVYEVATGKEVWHLPLRYGDFFPLQFTERDKFVLRGSSLADEVVIERYPWRLDDLLAEACRLTSRDLSQEEWSPYSEEPLKACPDR